MTEIDDGIEDYKVRLRAEAELSDLEEIEDHLRSLATDLAAHGMPAAAAVAEAARRLGDPVAVAREHARVRTPFGAKISAARTWSAVVLLSPFLYLAFANAVAGGLASRGGLDLGLGLVVVAALVARLPWARAIVLGTLGTGMLSAVVALAVGAGLPVTVLQLACYGGAMAFLAPWRRGELTDASLALALLGPAYAGSLTLLHFSELGDPAGALAMLCVVAAGVGGVMRARWAVVPAALGTAALMWGACGLEPWPEMPAAWQAVVFGSILAGAGAIAASGGLMRRTAGSTLGTLRAIVR